MSKYGRMRASFDSDASLGGMSSPPMSPPRHGLPVYFVQSPSRDSMQDGDSLSPSFSRATPRESPIASPLHVKHVKLTSMDSLPFGPHASKPGSRGILPQIRYVPGGTEKKAYGLWASRSAVVEEMGGEAERKVRLSRCWVVCIAVFLSMVVFFTGALLFWVSTMPKNPHVSVQKVAFSYFGLEDGVDNSGVPTMVASLNCTATLQLNNPSRFFTYHFKCSPLGFKYLDLSIAGGQLKPFVLQRSSTKNVAVAISADKQFLHGAGPSFDQSFNSAGAGVTLKLEGIIFTRAYVLGQLLKNKFSIKVVCTFKFASGGPTQWKVQELACPIGAA